MSLLSSLACLLALGPQPVTVTPPNPIAPPDIGPQAGYVLIVAADHSVTVRNAKQDRDLSHHWPAKLVIRCGSLTSTLGEEGQAYVFQNVEAYSDGGSTRMRAKELSLKVATAELLLLAEGEVLIERNPGSARPGESGTLMRAEKVLLQMGPASKTPTATVAPRAAARPYPTPQPYVAPIPDPLDPPTPNNPAPRLDDGFTPYPPQPIPSAQPIPKPQPFDLPPATFENSSARLPLSGPVY